MIFAIGNSVANGASSDSTIIVDNKTSMFDEIMSDMGASENDTSENNRAEMIRRQRALLDRTDEAQSGATNAGTANTCDAGLRKCMSDKCGPDFTKCANNSTTIWGQKLEACRATTKCTAHEYTLLAPEILADRDANVRMQYYNAVINCGNRYNDCIFTQCGKTLNKCLSKKDGDNAISKCASIARECREQDSGLAGRVMNVFGDLRTIATERVQHDEKRLYELRDLMRASCNRVGAMFDERTLDCVYTVNFFAGQDNTLMASKKLYAGDSFQCNADWFGIDITTYIENAQRLTRSQKSASAAALGAGVGTAAGLLSSGAIGRAIDTKKAENAVKSVKNEKEKEKEIDDQGEQGGNNPSGGAQGGENKKLGQSQTTFEQSFQNNVEAMDDPVGSGNRRNGQVTTTDGTTYDTNTIISNFTNRNSNTNSAAAQ